MSAVTGTVAKDRFLPILPAIWPAPERMDHDVGERSIVVLASELLPIIVILGEVLVPWLLSL
jgi:hypothetical protein